MGRACAFRACALRVCWLPYQETLNFFELLYANDLTDLFIFSFSFSSSHPKLDDSQRLVLPSWDPTGKAAGETLYRIGTKTKRLFTSVPELVKYYCAKAFHKAGKGKNKMKFRLVNIYPEVQEGYQDVVSPPPRACTLIMHMQQCLVLFEIRRRVRRVVLTCATSRYIKHAMARAFMRAAPTPAIGCIQLQACLPCYDRVCRVSN